MTRTKSEPSSIEDVVEDFEDLAEKADDTVSFGDALDKFGERSFAPFILVLSLIVLSPAGAVPAMPTFVALLIVIVAAQLLIGRKRIWMPEFFENRSISAEKIEKATDKLDAIAERLDTITKGRLRFLARGLAVRFAAFLIIVLCIAVPPLEVLPWAAAGPMLAIAIISLAIMARDGLTMLFAFITSALFAVGLTYYYFASDASDGRFIGFSLA